MGGGKKEEKKKCNHASVVCTAPVSLLYSFSCTRGLTLHSESKSLQLSLVLTIIGQSKVFLSDGMQNVQSRGP